eukprot:3934635-Rhodomonas_salina.4
MPTQASRERSSIASSRHALAAPGTTGSSPSTVLDTRYAISGPDVGHAATRDIHDAVIRDVFPDPTPQARTP